MSNYRFHRDLGSAMNGFITLGVFIFCIKLLGTGIAGVVGTLLISAISYRFAYPLTGLILRGMGIWQK